MPFEIVRNDITLMQVDAIVNTANPDVAVGYGVDAMIHKKAGPQLLEARKKIGNIAVGQSAVTSAFGLDAKYVIHTVGPIWQDGAHNEAQLLGRCYESALELAKKYQCQSVAFPLISTGNYGFPKSMALQIAIHTFSRFLMENEMYIYLVVFDKEAFDLSGKLFQSVAEYIDENYVSEKTADEYGSKDNSNVRRREMRASKNAPRCKESLLDEVAFYGAFASAEAEFQDWEAILKDLDAGFSETLLHLIDKSGKKDSEIYKKANVDRKLFSKIRNNPDYKPSKTTAIAFALALELNLDETKDFIARAGYALSHSSKFDIIIEYFILHGNYNIFELNEVLFAFDQPLIGV